MCATFFKYCLWWIYYFQKDLSNKKGGFLIFNITWLEILSSAFTRLIALLAALGYKIVIKSVRKYHVKLALVGFLYIITLAMKLITIYIRQDHKVSPAVNFITQFPVALINGVIFFWTVLAFKRTLSYLQEKRQEYKYQILYTLYVSFSFSLICSLVIYIFELIIFR